MKMDQQSNTNQNHSTQEIVEVIREHNPRAFEVNRYTFKLQHVIDIKAKVAKENTLIEIFIYLFLFKSIQ